MNMYFLASLPRESTEICKDPSGVASWLSVSTPIPVRPVSSLSSLDNNDPASKRFSLEDDKASSCAESLSRGKKKSTDVETFVASLLFNIFHFLPP